MITGLKARRRRISTLPPATERPAFLASLSLSPSTLAVDVDEEAQLTVTGLDQEGNPIEATGFSWASSVPSKAAVDSNGLVTGVAGGTTTVTVTHTASGLTATCAVECITPIVAVDHVVVTPTSLDLTEGGGTAQLTADPQDASNNSLLGRTVTWASDDTDIATVDSSGEVTPVAEGSANVTATCEAIDSTPVPVTVNPVAVGGHPNEPAGAVVIDETDMASLTELTNNGWTLTGTARLSFEVVAELTRTSTLTGRARYPTGFGGGSGPINISRPFSGKTTIYHDFDLMVSSNFYGHPGSSVNKVFFGTGGSAGAAPFYYSCQGNASGNLGFQVRTQNCPRHSTNSGGGTSRNIVTGYTITRGLAHRIIVIATLNTVDGSGNAIADGTIEVYTSLLGDTPALRVSVSNVVMRGKGTDGIVTVNGLSGTDKFDNWKWNPTWGGTGSTVPEEMYMWIGYNYLSGIT